MSNTGGDGIELDEFGERDHLIDSNHNRQDGADDLHEEMLKCFLEKPTNLEEIKRLSRSDLNLEVFLTKNLEKLYNEDLENASHEEELFLRLLKREKRRLSQKGENGPLEKAIDSTIKALWQDNDHQIYETSKCKNKPRASEGEIKTTAQEKLFLWAVLHSRQEIAEFFWRKCRDHIGAALTASTILKNLSEEAASVDDVGLAQKLSEDASQWENRATGVIDECYQTDKKKAHKLLVRKIAAWGNNTIFQLADVGEKLEFMSHSCCQTKLNQIWRGDALLYTQMWKICPCVVLPIFLPLLFWCDIEYDLVKTKREKDMSNGAMSVRSNGGHEERRCIRKFMNYTYDFYNAPVIKFSFHVVCHVLFLALFSFFLLTHLSPLDVKSPSGWEYTVYVWEGFFIIEEIRQDRIIQRLNDTTNVIRK